MNNILDKSICSCASRIKEYTVDGQLLGYKNAEKAVTRWAANFEPFLTNKALLARVIDNIRFVPDSEILDECQKFIKTSFNTNDIDIYYTSLGAETESSARIMCQLNSHTNYAPNLLQLLTKIEQQRPNTPVITFFDDFLNSGGQLTSIIDTWFENAPTNNKFELQSYENRCPLSADQLALLKKCELCFVFQHGTTIGCKRINDHLKKYAFSGSAYVINSFNGSETFSDDDIAQIEQNLDTIMGDKSIFKGFTYSEIAEIYQVFQEAGRALIELNKPDWEPERVQGRILGYGNTTKLFISQKNVPTVTLTCLWMGGEIVLRNERINWQPLVKRIDKNIGGREEYSVSDSNKNNAATADINLDGINLDITDGSPAFDVTLVGIYRHDELNFQPEQWQQCTNKYIANIDSEVISLLQNINPQPTVSFYSLNKCAYSQINSSLSYKVAGYFYPLKIKNIIRCNFGSQDVFIAIRIQFKKQPDTITKALKLNYHLPINAKQNSGKTGFCIKHQENILTTGDFLCNIIGIPQNKANKRFRSLVYLREHSNLFNTNDSRLNTIFSLLAGFNNNTPTNINKKNIDPAVVLDLDATISISEKGVALLCGSSCGQNKTYLAEHYHTNYLTFYLLAWHILLTKKRFELNATKPADHNWHTYKNLIDFPCSDDLHLKEFFQKTLNTLGIST